MCASDRAPSGARGHRVVLTKEAAETALPSLLGMAVDYKAGWDGHDARQKCGIITAAHLEGQRLMVSGFLFARDFPELGEAHVGVKATADGEMGMSYELADAHVADMRAQVWTLTRATFTGAAILLREKAAYRSTSFRLRRRMQWTNSGLRATEGEGMEEMTAGELQTAAEQADGSGVGPGADCGANGGADGGAARCACG